VRISTRFCCTISGEAFPFGEQYGRSERRARAAEGPVSKISSKRLCKSVCLGDVQGGRKGCDRRERSALVAEIKATKDVPGLGLYYCNRRNACRDKPLQPRGPLTSETEVDLRESY
jgi:hypothetical protein